MRRLALIAAALFLAGSGTALAALRDLPPGGRVDDDLAAGIDPAGHVVPSANNADVVGGTLAAEKPRVPWAIFAHEIAGPSSRIFVRSFRGGAWTTQGQGALNFDALDIAEAPSLDFAGAGRTVPWATWAERGTAAGGPDHAQIFASRFDAPTGAWQLSGANRAAAGAALPSLNIHTDRDARDPAVAGGSVADGTQPGPWIAWSEAGAHDPGTGVDQLFVARPSAPGQTTCDPAAFRLGDDATAGAALGGFCFGQVGVERLGADPSLNVDRTRTAADPDIAFAGAGDKVPWVVWHETGASHAGLHDNSMVFAAKGVAPGATAPAGTVDGGLNWVVVGPVAQGVQDDGPGGGTCAGDQLHEEDCAVNVDLAGNAGPPRIAAGTMTPGTPTVPWIVWEEGPDHAVIVARLVGTGADARFVLANRGRAVGQGLRPEITFSGNTPYVSSVTGLGDVITGHFTAPDSFVRDNMTDGVTLTGDSRASLSSACTADPFTADGSACPAGALGTPFALLFDEGANTPALRAKAYQPAPPTGESATAVPRDGAALGATVEPEGSTVDAHFEYGPTTAYGSVTPAQVIGLGGGPQQPLTATLSGLPAGTTIHYRVVLRTDFATETGFDHTFTTLPPAPPPTAPPATPPPAAPPPPHDGGPPAKPHAPVVTLHSRLSHTRLTITVGVDEASTVLARATLKGRVHGRARTLSLGRATARAAAGRSGSVRLALSRAAVRALRTWKGVRIAVTVTATAAGGPATTRRLNLRV